MRETQLYHKGSNQQTYERFDTTRLASDAALLRRFVFLTTPMPKSPSWKRR